MKINRNKLKRQTKKTKANIFL